MLFQSILCHNKLNVLHWKRQRKQCLNRCQLHHYFDDFVNMKCLSWFTFRHLEEMKLCFVYICGKKMFLSFLLVTEVKVIYLNDPPFCFWYRNIDVSNFCVGLVGGGRDGWGKLRSERRAAHVLAIKYTSTQGLSTF